MSAGRNQKMMKSKVVTNRNFCNKLWNIARYIESIGATSINNPQAESLGDHWILQQLISTKDKINKDLYEYRFSEAYNKLYHFVWDDLADWYIEASKLKPNTDLLNYILASTLIIAHPMAPYVTEVIWQNLYPERGLLAGQTYERLIDHDQTKALDFEKVRQVISETRRVIHSLGQRDVIMTYTNSELIDKNRTLVKKLSGVNEVRESTLTQGIKLTGLGLDIWLDIDKNKAKTHLQKLTDQKTEQATHIKRLEERLKNKSYINKAPEHVIEETKAQLEEYKNSLEDIEKEIKLFANL
jgi:valyl-tRNA synthetase